ncbi:MAG TPA: N4-gp56 family major capsid protein, partial [Ilumatobacteraceae bacterium]|nr:N4-gp56 family major capsid protein [Ilumatobacteraceae bacterium]
MARTIVGVNDAKAVKRFTGLLAMDASQRGWWSNRFMARGAEAEVPIQILTDLESDAGEEIKYDLLAELRMAPVEGEDNLEGNEEAQRFYTDSVYIDQARCGVNTGGRMTRKRTLHNLREKARRQQSNWWARMQDEMLFMYQAGARGVNDNFLFPSNWAGRANNALVAPDANHIVYGGDATSFANIDATDKLTLPAITAALMKALTQGGGATNIPVLQPCKIDGAEVFVGVMHTWQEDDLRKSTVTGDWLDLQKAAAGAEGKNSPLFRQSLGMHRNIVLHSHRNVIRFSNAGSGANVA